MLDRAVVAVWIGMVSLGAGAVTIAQGVFDPAAEAAQRWVGGGVLIAVAVLVVRWSRQMSQEVRATLSTSLDKVQATLDQTIAILEAEREAWHQERTNIRTERDQLRHELMEATALLREERALRISLERAGIADRRHQELETRPEEPDGVG